ncbi:hypothetical protein MRX96_059567 [Rhipicephalus microplus]
MKANIAGKDINLEIDTESQACCCLFFRKIQACPMKASNVVLRSYNGGVMAQLGTFSSHVTIGDQSFYTDFVIQKDHGALLGLQMRPNGTYLQQVLHKLANGCTRCRRTTEGGCFRSLGGQRNPKRNEGRIVK